MFPLHKFNFKIVVNGKEILYQAKCPWDLMAYRMAREACPDADSITLIDVEINPIAKILYGLH